MDQPAVVHPKNYLRQIRKSPNNSCPSLDDERTGRLAEVVREIRPFTMVPTESLMELAHQVRAVLSEDIPGNFVECGVWRGGAALLMAELLRQAGVKDRKVWLFDSFEGLPPPQEIDGSAALAYAKDTTGPWHFENCNASLEEVQGTAQRLGLTAYTEFVKGWFEDTLPANQERIGTIAILRIDADWYASVRSCLEHLYDRVVPGGFVIFDDYYTYDGCAIAVHEFLGNRSLSYRLEGVIRQSKYGAHCQTAFFRKGRTWKHLKKKLFKRGLPMAVEGQPERSPG
jgi:O-methyltransferase